MKTFLKIGNPERPHPDHRSTVVWLGLGLLLVLVAAEFVASSMTPADATLGVASVAAPAISSGEVVPSQMRSYETFDHSVVNEHSTANDSDEPGASIAAYGP